MKKVTVVYDSFACVADIEPAEYSLSLILEDATADQRHTAADQQRERTGGKQVKLCHQMA